MKIKIPSIITILFFSISVLHAQIPDYRADNIIITNPTKNGRVSITELSRDSLLLYRGTLSSIEPEIRHGRFYFFNEAGNISVSGLYNEDVPFGNWVYYDDSGDTIHSVDYTKVWQYLQGEGASFEVDWDAINAMRSRQKKNMLENGVFTQVSESPKFGQADTDAHSPLEISKNFENANIDALSRLEFSRFIEAEMQYPFYATLLGLEGVVEISFVVDANGNIKAPTIVNPSITDFNIEAIRIISESPSWESGKIDNTPVNVLVTVPVLFSTNDNIIVNDYEIDAGNQLSCEKEVDSPPYFKGADLSNFRYHIANTLRYPESAAENGIQGRVVVQFVVNQDGTVGDISIVESADPQLEREAIRVVERSPKWAPAKINGQAVACTLKFPMNFVLDL